MLSFVEAAFNIRELDPKTFTKLIDPSAHDVLLPGLKFGLEASSWRSPNIAAVRALP